MGTEIFLGALLVLQTGVIVYQQRFFMGQIQKLVDKAMSHSFESYVQSTAPPAPKVHLVPEPPEDLRAMQEFSMTQI